MLGNDYSIAELVIMGFEGKTISPETLRTIQKEKAPLFILFTAPNFESKEQLIELTNELQRRVTENGDSLPAIISADQEGGRVQRFRNGFTVLPSAQKVGKLSSHSSIVEYSKLQARELSMAGVNLNYAPVCDVNTNPDNPVIGERAYSTDANRAAEIVPLIIEGHRAENVLTCLKHFPGHGDTHVDSHEDLPTVTTPIDMLRKREWLPFQAGIKANAPFVMSAHILMPEIDSKNPGTFSPEFLKQYLRKELQFQGSIVSDDMEMGAIINHYGKEEAPVLALAAGCDLLCYRHEAEALIAIEAIKKAVQDGKLNKDLLSASIDRTRKIRFQLTRVENNFTLAQRLAQIGSSDHTAFLRRNFP